MTQQNGRMARRVLVSTLSLLFGTAAHAGFYPGHVDPGGNGDDIPGFTADLVFNIPDSCIHSDGSGWDATNQNTGVMPSGPFGCGDASVVSGTVYLYSTDAGDTPTGPILDSFALNPWPLLGVYSVNGAIKGVDTDAMGPYTTSGFYTGDQFWLQFVSGFCEFGCTEPGHFTDPAYLSANDINNFGPPGTVTFGAQCETATNCFVNPTPEPGTLALLFGALGGGWLARRRKRDASA
jgi:hypothetical protein